MGMGFRRVLFPITSQKKIFGFTLTVLAPFYSCPNGRPPPPGLGGGGGMVIDITKKPPSTTTQSPLPVRELQKMYKCSTCMYVCLVMSKQQTFRNVSFCFSANVPKKIYITYIFVKFLKNYHRATTFHSENEKIKSFVPIST